MKEYRPTKDELAVINERFAKVPYKSVDDLYVFWLMAIDNQMTLVYTKAHPDTLKKWAKDLEEEGVSFLFGHHQDYLPFARSFKGLVREHEGLVELFGKFFMQKGLKIGEINTDDFMQAYLGGTLQDVSIGFKAGWYECSICGLDIRDPECSHMPGQKYEIDGEEVLCFAWIMHSEEKPAILGEVSAVFKGAVPRAKFKGKKEVPAAFVSSAEELKSSDIEKEVCMQFNFPIKSIKADIDEEYKKDKEGGEKRMIDLEKFFAGEYSEEELKDLVLTEEEVDEILSIEVSFEEKERIKENFGEELATLLITFPAYELLIEDEEYARWTRTFINSLPDSSFAVIEPAYKRGETKNKNARHLPHHGKGGGGTKNENLDLPHLRNALARMNQIKPVTDSISAEELRKKATSHLENHRSALTTDEKSDEMIKLEEKIKTLETNNKILLEQNNTLKTETANLKNELEEVKAINVEQQKKIEDLEKTTEDGKAYREDLIKEVLELGVKLHGNSFDKNTNEKMLKEPTRTLDEIKKIKDQYLKELDEKFPSRKQLKGKEHALEGESKTEIPDDAFKIGN